MFKKAIVRTPGKSMINGLTTAELGLPNYEKALFQHAEYIKALGECGLEVIVLEKNEQYNDSTFVEDVALLTKNLAIVTNPGAPSRRGETTDIKRVLRDYYINIEEVQEPGTFEGGDSMMVGSHFYIGLSERTNECGAQQVIKYLKSVIRLEKVLHLKTGVAYLEHNNLVATIEFLMKEEFKKFNILKIEKNESYAANCIWVNDRVLIPKGNILKIDKDESYAANCIWINDIVLIPKGYPKARETIENAEYMIKEVDVSEFRKLDGGLSCLSLRF